MPYCVDCGQEKTIGEMVQRPDRSPFYRSLCKACKVLRNHTDQVQNSNRQYFQEHKLELYAKRSERRHGSINIRLANAVRARLRIAMKRNASQSALTILGCSIEEFRSYLELKFQEGMNWDNYGQWHLDHIQPLSKFDLCDAQQLKIACNFKNIQPLWARDNLSKGNR